MTDPTTQVCEIVAKRVHPALHYRISADAAFGDLGLNEIDQFFSIPCDVEEEFGIEIPDHVIAGWTHVSDIIATVAERGRIAA